MRTPLEPVSILFLSLVGCSAPSEADRWSEPYVIDYELPPPRSATIGVARAVPVRHPVGGDAGAALGRVQLPGLTVRDEDSLRALMEALSAISGTSIVVDEAAEQEVLGNGVVFDLNLTAPISLVHALNLVTDLAGSEVAWELRHGVVFVTTRDRLSASMTTRIYDVSDLTFGVPSFRAPVIGDLRRPEDRPDYDEDELAGRTAAFDEDTLLTLIQDSIAPDSWDDEGVSITLENGRLIVRHREGLSAASTRSRSGPGGAARRAPPARGWRSPSGRSGFRS